MKILTAIYCFFKRPRNTKSDHKWRDGYEAFAMGMDFYGKGQLQEALGCFDAAISQGVKSANVYGSRGLCLQSLEYDLDAIDDLTKAIELDPSDSNFYFIRSISKGSLGDLHGRIADLQEAIQLSSIDNAATRSHNAFAKEKGYKEGIVGKYRIDLVCAKLDLTREADDERRQNSPLAHLGPDLVSRRRVKARRRPPPPEINRAIGEQEASIAAFKFACPHCGQRISTTTEYIGVHSACPTCSQSFDVPSPETISGANTLVAVPTLEIDVSNLRNR